MRGERARNSLGVVRDIEALGQRWHDWRQGDLRQSHAVELLCGSPDPRSAPEIPVGREDFNVAGEIMVCLHAECSGFVRGLTRRESHVYWSPLCHCPNCGQRYLVRDL
jgi:hypothetical protein